MANQWYLAKGGQKYGPFDFEQLQKGAANGQFQPTDYVWCSASNQWYQAGTVQGLFNSATSPFLQQVGTPAQATSNALVAEYLKGAGVGAAIGLVVSLGFGGFSFWIVLLGAIIESISYGKVASVTLRNCGQCPPLSYKVKSGCVLAFMLWAIGLLFMLVR